MRRLALLAAWAAAEDAYAPSAAPTVQPTSCPRLRAATSDECPDDSNVNVACTASLLVVGDVCEGDGECGTDTDLNNCEHYGEMSGDIYVVIAEPTYAPTYAPSYVPSLAPTVTSLPVS